MAVAFGNEIGRKGLEQKSRRPSQASGGNNYQKVMNLQSMQTFSRKYGLLNSCAAGIEGLVAVVDEEVAIFEGFTIWAFTIYHLL